MTDLDADVFRSAYGVGRVDVVENGVDTAYFRPSNTPRDPNKLLFLGSLDWRPNLDGVEQLLVTVFPAIRAKEPQAHLVLVGRNPAAALRARVAASPGVELHADVADVRPYLAACGLLLVPLRIGGGSRIKILEALSSELPVVSTRIGAEGLALVPDTHLTVVETVADMVPAILQGIRHPERRGTRRAAAVSWWPGRYDWDRLAARLEEVWFDCLESRRV